MKHHINNAMTFSEYLSLIDGLLEQRKTTGPLQSEQMFEFGKLNRKRMSRLEKTVELSETVGTQISALDVDWVWLVLTEGWCGDAAQNIPVIEKVASANPGIRTRYLLRDENPELMDAFLTDGTRSIPKLIVIDQRTNKVLGTWGSRPAAAQEHFLKLRSEGLEKAEVNEAMQRWYNADRGRSLQKELTGLSRRWADAASVDRPVSIAA